jgi:ribokinase
MTAPGAPITVLGSLNMDLVVRTPTLPRPGQTLLGTSFDTICGGKGANQAIASARAGGTVAILGAVGDDGFGAELRANLDRHGVDATRLRVTPGPSGVAAILVDDNGENVIVVVAGANSSLTELTAEEAGLLTSSSMVVAQLEVPLSTVVAGAVLAHAAGPPFLLNPSPMAPLPPALLGATSVLVVNEGEAAELGTAAIATIPHVITTLGARGARYRGSDGMEFSIPAPTVQAIDSTGAGDAFTGALAVAWTEGKSPKEALRWACAAGALATTVAGASAPDRAAIDALANAS